MINGGWWYRLAPVIVLLFALSGCRKNVNVRSLRSLPTLIDYQGSQHGIDLQVKKLNEHDCQSILGKPSHRLFKKFRKRSPISPLQISVTNNTEKLIALKPSDIDLPQVPYKKVANRLSNSSLLQIFGTILSSLFIGSFIAMGSFLALGASGILLFATGSLSITIPAAVIGSSAALALPLFLVIGTPVLSAVKGVETARANQSITRDIKQFSLHDQLIVEPYETVDMLIFVEKLQFKPNFTINITDPEHAQNQITFNVRIPTLQNFIGR